MQLIVAIAFDVIFLTLTTALIKHVGNKHWSYIQEHTEINEVIFSGGDPLMASDEHLQWLIDEIEKIPHIKRLRIHTRLPIVIPQRITPALVNALRTTRLKPTIVFHINHANEIDATLHKRLNHCWSQEFHCINQSVLLKGINDSADTLAQLSERLFDAGIQPYYLHLFDKVQGVAHFDLTESEAKKITLELMAILPGF